MAVAIAASLATMRFGRVEHDGVDVALGDEHDDGAASAST